MLIVDELELENGAPRLKDGAGAMNDAVALLFVAFLSPRHDEGMRIALSAWRERAVVSIESVGYVEQAVLGEEGGERFGVEDLVRWEAQDTVGVLVGKRKGSG